MAQKNQVMASSDFNLQKLNTKELGQHISATIEIGGNIAIFGMRGSGKTEISKYEINKSGFREVYLNLSVFERVDMGGYPDIIGSNKQRKFVEYLLPKFYEAMVSGDQDVVALLDEVDKADSSVWAPLLEFTQFRSINGNPLPKLRAVIMTGNLISEGGHRPCLPLLDRAEKYLVQPDPALWLEWAGKIGRIHPSITSYINDHPADLAGAVDPEDRYADPSPRGWTRASHILYSGESKKWNSDLLNDKVCGCIGKFVGLKYKNYYEHYLHLLPMINKVFKGEDISSEYRSLEPTKKLVTCMMACARTAMELDKCSKDGNMELPNSVKYIGKFLRNVENSEPENVLISIKSQIQLDRVLQHKLDELPNWKDCIDDIKKLNNEQ